MHRASTSDRESASARTPIGATASASCSSAAARRGPGRRAQGARWVSAPTPGRGGQEDARGRAGAGRGGARAGGGASYPAVPFASRGDRPREAAAGGAPAAQRRPHPAPLQREHEAEAGVPRLRPGSTLDGALCPPPGSLSICDESLRSGYLRHSGPRPTSLSAALNKCCLEWTVAPQRLEGVLG